MSSTMPADLAAGFGDNDRNPAAGTARWRPIAGDIARGIKEITYLRDYGDGIYRDLDLDLTLDYMRRRFVAPLSTRIEIERATLLDCAAGFGWLAFAYLLSGGGRAILVEADGPRLEAAQAIAARLGIAVRCEFRRERIQDIDLCDDAVDIFASIETLEHVGRAHIRASVGNITRIAKKAVVLTTPNFLFPVVAHDTELPLAHWLPAGLRHPYAAAAGRPHLDRGNQFLRPWDLAPLVAKFRPVTPYQTFDTRAAYDGFYPHYAPYGASDRQRHRIRPKFGHRGLQIALATVLGRWSFALAPSLASIWLRRESPALSLPSNELNGGRFTATARLRHHHANGLTRLQRFDAGPAQGGDMDENVLAAVIG
jgi:ubiquinone/menaquinone biosynthesis C-methylase UbiE